MKKLIAILFFTLFTLLSSLCSEVDSLLVVLDSTLAANKSYLQPRIIRIKSLKNLIGKQDLSIEQNYEVNTLLYKEYLKFNFDSTLNYLNLNLEIAQKIKNKEWIIETKLRLSHIFSSSGLYIESIDILSSIQTTALSSKQKLEFYSCCQHIYAELAMYTTLKHNVEKFDLLSKIYRDSLLAFLHPNSDEYLLLYESKLQDEGKFDKSRQVNSQLMSRTTLGSPEYALYAFQRAISYRIQGNIEMEEKFLILSAISDIRSAVKDNVSLTLLAIILFDKKEIDRAYRYIKFSLEDAKFYNARLRYIEISKILPLISEAFQMKSERQKTELRFYSLVITILALLLIVALIIMYSQMKKLSKTRLDLQSANKQLNELSQDLYQMNTQLKTLNKELLESNHIKEEYIGFFLGMCSAYIDKLENYRKMVHRKVTSGQFEDLFTSTKSTHFIDSELNEFYSNFDNTFIHLFPNFVEQFNSLLIKEEGFVLKIDELLNTELRIFALIRLGITDSSKIASFLRYSVTTIYNYRTRVKNKALVPRDDFERLVRMIGTS
jgi:hypothetical protein